MSGHGRPRQVTPLQVEHMRVHYAEGKTMHEIQRLFPYSTTTIYRVVTGQYYPDEPGPITRKRERIRRTPEDLRAAEIRLAFQQGKSEVELAAMYWLAQNTISDIIQHKSCCPSTTRRRRRDEQGHMKQVEE